MEMESYELDLNNYLSKQERMEKELESLLHKHRHDIEELNTMALEYIHKRDTLLSVFSSGNYDFEDELLDELIPINN